ncbi:unnamed protein product [Diatraea saccharalis]|uniref:Homeobox domain-containing protein n=1 Tax=Diatraea saccharalis TaxID=40085 RepID=A0A9P0FZ64_9NEOP|nr:unnamed protein product [Diatraea saccharalis]
MNTHMNSEQESIHKGNTEDMQTVVSNYVTPDLIEQADSRLIDIHNGFQNNNYSIDYAYDKSPEEKVNIDEDKDEELIITDDIVEETKESHETSVTIDNLEEERDNNEQITNTEELRKVESFEPSWHPHVYGKPPKMPTPHTIEYILGINGRGNDENKRNVSQLIKVKRNFDVRMPYSNEKSIQVQTDVPDRKLNISVHKNKLQEQLLQRVVRTSDSELEKVQYGFKGDDQPLNLSVPKSRESSWSSTDEDKICKDPSKLIKRKKSTDDVRSPLGGEGSLTSEEGEDQGVGRRKKARTTFTGRQIFELEKLFEVKKYLSSGERADMAKLLNVTETQVKIVFISSFIFISKPAKLGDMFPLGLEIFMPFSLIF